MSLLSTVFAAVDLTPPEAAGLTWDLEQLVTWAIRLTLIVAGLIFFFMLLFGGIRWILSGGDKTNTENARNQITAALIGLIVVFAAWAIARLIDQIFGFNLFQLEMPTLTPQG